ncbi:MAG: hypothetical protein IJ460_00505 [Clostridia bacterium]|nr:hypothetical protein [Clostridia bacterium]
MISCGEYDALLSHVAEAVKLNLNDAIINHNEIMYTLIVLILISCCTNIILGDDFRPDVSYINISAAFLLLSLFSGMYILADKAVTDIFELLKNVLPVFLGFSVISAKSAYLNTVFVFYMTGFQWLSKNLLLPLIAIAAVMSIISSSGGGIDFSKGKSSLLAAVNWTIGIYTTLFLCFIKMLSISLYPADRIIYGGIRYTLSKGIPVVGGYVSDSLESVLGGVSVIRSSVGVAAAAILVTVSAVPAVLPMLIGWLLKLLGGFTAIFSDNSTSALVGDIGICISELGILLLVCAIGFITGFSIMLSG